MGQNEKLKKHKAIKKQEKENLLIFAKIEKINADVKFWDSLFQNVIKTAIGGVTVFACFWCIFDGVKAFSGENGAESLKEIANIFKYLELKTIIGYVLTAGSLVAWKAERNGKKRAIKEKAIYQKQAEKNDPVRTSSGLNDTGDTPKKNEGKK